MVRCFDLILIFTFSFFAFLYFVQCYIAIKKKISKRQIVLVLWLKPIHSNPYPECNCTHLCEKCVVDDHCSHHFSTTAFILLCHSRKYEREKEEKTLLYKEQDNVNERSLWYSKAGPCAVQLLYLEGN